MNIGARIAAALEDAYKAAKRGWADKLTDGVVFTICFVLALTITGLLGPLDRFVADHGSALLWAGLCFFLLFRLVYLPVKVVSVLLLAVAGVGRPTSTP